MARATQKTSAGSGAKLSATAGKATAAKQTAAKAPAKKATTTKAPANKAPAGKAPTKRAPAKAPAKKAPSKKAPAKKTVAKKAVAKAPAKNAVAKKAPAKKAVAKKAPALSSSKKAPAKKAVAPVAAAPKKPAAPKPPPKRKINAALLKFFEQQKEILIGERANYLHQADSLKAEADSLAEQREPGDVQFDEESGEGDTLAVERERDLALSAQARAAIEEIDQALARIEDGTYGICMASGLAIPRERLKAIPWARERVEYKVGGFGRR